ncbi:hypothetical protein KC640_01760, partial [Candidatus Dojkabacteria bacterium]|nr:hypothetical protein [Candidatus Dojkabacteria bacterium]
MEVDTNLILIVLFWIAPAIVIIFNLLWDIDFLQRKEYGLHRIYQTLRWDSEFTHRGRFQLILKLALFAAVASFVFARSNIVPAVATLLAFAWWINEVFEVITKLASKQRPRPRLDIRGVAILYLSVMLLAIIPITIAASLPSTPTSLTKLVISSAGEILPVETASGTVIPAAYAALIFSALLALAYDLAAPFIVVTMTILTLPFAWLRGRFIIWRVQRKLASIEPTVIVIAASANHPHIRPLLSKLVDAGTVTVSLPDVETTPRGLARSLRGKLQSDTAVVIAELGAWRTGDMYRLCKVVNPDISILPGIDDSHIGTFGTIDLTLDAKLELIRGTKPTGTVIFNADDELVSSLVRTTNHKEIICTEHKHRLGEFSDNQLTIDHYLARHMKDATVIEYAAGKLAIGGIDKDAGLDLAMAIAAAAEAGTALDSAPATLQGFPIQKL